jgi:glutamyl-tRNA synthetase
MGNARTALFNVLQAKAENGHFLLRIEDTDQERSKPEFIEGLKRDLLWLGLDWQEGIDQDQGNGPYQQSERQAIYDKYYQQLEEQGVAYPCFCSQQELAVSRKLQLSAGKPPRYSGKCCSLNADEIAAKLAEGLKPTLRFKMPKNKEIVFEDLVKGKQSFQAEEIGDFIIRRANGTASFMYCNAIDDAMMGVTHALRGEDHLTNTPRQLVILESLTLQAPTYGHFALILGMDGAPLSKRNGSRSIQELRELGYLPSAVTNYMARLGHYYADNDFMSLDELAAKFADKHLSTSPSRYDEKQLLFWQKHAVGELSDANFYQWANVEITEDKKSAFMTLAKETAHFPEEVAILANIYFKEILPLSDEAKAVVKEAGNDFFEAAAKSLAQHGADFSAIKNQLMSELNVKGKKLFMPLRLALTGQMHGPDLGSVIALIGVDNSIKRLKGIPC